MADSNSFSEATENTSNEYENTTRTSASINTTTVSTSKQSSKDDSANSPTSKRTSTPSVDNSSSQPENKQRMISPSIEISNISVTGTMYQFTGNDNERTLTSFMEEEKESHTLTANNNNTMDFTDDENDTTGKICLTQYKHTEKTNIFMTIYNI